jgi:hypothetical protein
VNSSRERDRSIERLLRQSLKTPQNGGVTDSCLDAETLAALLDGGLSGAALEMAESHLGDCARCQSLAGALARIDSAVPDGQPKRGARSWLAWVVPLTAVAAAVAVWVAVPHHSAPLSQSTQLESRTAETPALQPAAPAGRSETAAGGNDFARPPGVPAPASAAKAQTDAATESRQAAEPVEADKLTEQSALSKSSPSSAAEAQIGAPAGFAGARAVAAPAPAPAPSGTAVGGVGGAVGGAAPRASANALDAERSTARRAEVAAIEITSPDPMVRWRIVGPMVQRSTDGGASWETQSTGAVADLTAGAAPSPLVCWVVGRGGVVLLSTDGRSWRRVAFPEATDLSAVRARDARAAAVSTADGRTFSTTDAGVTWVARPLQDF